MTNLFLEELIEEQKNGSCKRNIQLGDHLEVEIDKKADERFPDYSLIVSAPYETYRLNLTEKNWNLEGKSPDKVVRFAVVNLSFAIKEDFELSQKHRLLKPKTFNEGLILNRPKDKLIKKLNLYTKRALAWKIIEFAGYEKAKEFSQLVEENKGNQNLIKEYQFAATFYKKLPSIGKEQSNIMLGLMSELFERYRDANRRELFDSSNIGGVNRENYVPHLVALSKFPVEGHNLRF